MTEIKKIGNILRIKTKNQDIAVVKKGGKYLYLELQKISNAEFKESDHPRDKDGQFTSKDGGESGEKKIEKKENRPERRETPVDKITEKNIDAEIKNLVERELSDGALSFSDRERLKELKQKKAEFIRDFYVSESKNYKPAKNIEELKKNANSLTDEPDENNFSEKSNLNTINSATKTIIDTFAKYGVNKKLGSYKEENRPDCLACANGENVVISTKFSQASDETIKKWYNDNFASYKKVQEVLSKEYDNYIKEAEETGNENLANIYREAKRKQQIKSFSRWTVKTTLENYTRDSINHELGHYFMANALRKDIMSGAIPKGTTPKQLRSSLPTYKELLKVFSKAKRSGDIYKISEYASESPDEFFAECFAMKEGGEELPQYINDFIEGVVKK